jgi:hypothetical protein
VHPAGRQRGDLSQTKEGAEPNFKDSACTRCWPTATTPASRWPGAAPRQSPGRAGRSGRGAAAGFRRRLLVTCDGAGASHDLIARLDKLAARPGYQLTYSVGWELGGRERAAIGAVPAGAWQIAVDARGEVRERRAEGACSDIRCPHRRCWIEEAHVAELTGLLRDGPAGDQLEGWPKAMRVFARRERPHPGAQLTLFEAGDGWRYSLRVTNRPAATKGWLGQNACIDAAHRVHARVEDAIRTGKTAASASTPPPRWR